MFGIFRKKKNRWQEIYEAERNRFNSDILPVLQAVANCLPSKYGQLKERFNQDLLHGCGANGMKVNDNVMVFRIDYEFGKKYETERNNYAIKNIQLFSKTTNSWKKLDLHIVNNIPTAFVLLANDWNFDLNQIDTNNIEEFSYGNHEEQRWKKIIGRIPSAYKDDIDLTDGFEIELDGEKFFMLKAFGDGDYIAIKESREIYGLIHGKNLKEKLFDSPNEFFKALDNGEFDFQLYYDSRV